MLSAKCAIGFDRYQNKSTPYHYYLSQTVIGDRLPQSKFFKKIQLIMDELNLQLHHADPQIMSVLDDAYNEYLDLSGITAKITEFDSLYTE
ncbi:TPA: hypothetical protein ACF3I9_004476 [Klebsiella aerogenes]